MNPVGKPPALTGRGRSDILFEEGSGRRRIATPVFKEDTMAKCKSCGSEFEDAVKACPECGDLPTVETIGDVSGLGLKEKRATLFEEIREEHDHEREMHGYGCGSCGDTFETLAEECPTCGEVGGVVSISALPPLNLREKHKQLKQEIREAKEKGKEGR